MSRNELWCPVCEEMVPHDRGYLKEHYRNKTRGQLDTGTKTLCDGSNQKPPQDTRTVTFTGMCTNCVSTVRREFKETYPGSLNKYGGVMVINCPECGEEGHYCKNCDHNLTLEKRSSASIAGPLDQQLMELLNQNTGNGQPLDPALVWVDTLREADCPDGEAHEAYHREHQERPVVLTDNHVIREPDDG